MKKIALPEVIKAAMIARKIKMNWYGFSLKFSLLGFGMVSYFILLTIRIERTTTRGITISSEKEVKPPAVL